MLHNRKIILSTGELHTIDVEEEKLLTVSYCFILEHGKKIMASYRFFTKLLFAELASKHPRAIIEEVFGDVEEAMDMLTEAKHQGGLWYNGKFVKL